MDNNKNKKYDYHEHDFDFMEVNNVASATDCTGLIQTPAMSDAMAESYTDIYNIPKADPEDNPEGDNRKTKKR